MESQTDSSTYSKDQSSEITASAPTTRPRLNLSKEEQSNGSNKSGEWGTQKDESIGEKRKHAWGKIARTEEYVDMVGEMMYPKKLFKPYGYDTENGRFPINRISTLGYLLNPLRRVPAFERWSPYEVAIFESSIYLYGKDFSILHKYIKTKTVKEIIEFYYDWKNTSHYRLWKKAYVPDDRIVPIVIPDK